MHSHFMKIICSAYNEKVLLSDLLKRLFSLASHTDKNLAMKDTHCKIPKTSLDIFLGFEIIFLIKKNLMFYDFFS